jgi:hypothetical protein
MPMYPYYHYHQSQTMGLPAHIFSPTAAGPIASVPAIMSKPASIAPTTGTHNCLINSHGNNTKLYIVVNCQLPFMNPTWLKGIIIK